MSVSATGPTKRDGPVFLSFGFRPFFLAAGAWAAIALAVWACMLHGRISLPSRFDPLTWHIHEMLFGFVMATIGGFLLTAIPNWTGRSPVSGWRLAALVGLWLLGRVVCLVSGLMPLWISILADLSFPIALLIVAAHEVVAARNWRNLPVAGVVGIFTLANLCMHLEAAGFAVPPGQGWRLGLVAAIILISVIGGRIVPSFTRNWLVARGSQRLPASRNWVDRTALGLLHASLVAWAFLPALRPVGYVLVAAGVVNAVRLARWRGAATVTEPLLLILHVGYAWVALGAAALGLSMLIPAMPFPAAIHALTAGAIATMILAVMTRATLGHTSRPLTANAVTVAIYVLVTLAALVRVGAAWAGADIMPFLTGSAALWILSFALFTIVYGRMHVTAAIRRPAE